jgi:hypothetical protein
MWTVVSTFSGIARLDGRVHLVVREENIVNIPSLHVDPPMGSICHTVHHYLDLLRSHLRSLLPELLSDIGNRHGRAEDVRAAGEGDQAGAGGDERE